MKKEEEIITVAFSQLEMHTGYKWEWKQADNELDGMVDLHFNNSKEKFLIEAKNELREYQLAKLQELNMHYKPLMVVANRIFPTLKEKLRQMRINYLDAAGNVYINTGKNVIWLEGFKHIETEKPVTSRAFTKTGLKTVFYLLLHQEAINMPHRTLAKATNVALGNIKNVIVGLEQAGFVLKLNAKKMQLQNKRLLLDRWIAGYGETLKPALHMGNFKLPPKRTFLEHQNFPMKMGNTIWGGEPAAEILTGYLKPQLWTVYTTEKRNTLMLQWKLLPAPEGNIKIYEKFWNDELKDKDLYAPVLLVYADLILTGDPRCIETAGIIFDKHLKDEFE